MATGQSKTKWESDLIKENSKSKGTVKLSYDGRLSERDVLNMPPGAFHCLHQFAESSNRLYFGDNLSVLSALMRDQSVVGKIKLIYIDPPYATGGVFKSRAQKDAYTDLLSGANYIEFIRQRLIFLRELLAEDGSIYIHLDGNMAFHIKVIMDDLFGVKNFRNWITRKKCNPKNYTRKTYGNISDFILFYTKSDQYIWHRPYDLWTPESAQKGYQYIEETTGRRYKKVPIHAPGTRNGATGQLWKGMLPPPGKHWQYTPDKLDEMDARGEIYWSPNGNPRRKVYFDQSPGKLAQDIWLDFKDAHNQNIKITGYPTEKNADLLHRIVKASSNPEDLVLDCFAGSGTTLDVANELGRRWIGVDNSLRAIDTILKRFAIGKEVMGDFVNGGRSQREHKKEIVMDLFAFAASKSANHSSIEEKENDTKPSPKTIKFSIFTGVTQKNELIKIINKWQLANRD